MRGTNDVEFPGDNGSQTTVVSTATDNNDVNGISNDGNGNNGGKGDQIKRSNWSRSGISPDQFYYKLDQRIQPEYCG